MYRIGVVGDKDSILAFKVIGIDVYPVIQIDEARKTIDKLAREQYGVIFVTEQIAAQLKETIDRYDRQILPAIILIPSNLGTLNIGMQKIRENTEKAVGMNIL